MERGLFTETFIEVEELFRTDFTDDAGAACLLVVESVIDGQGNDYYHCLIGQDRNREINLDLTADGRFISQDQKDSGLAETIGAIIKAHLW